MGINNLSWRVIHGVMRTKSIDVSRSTSGDQGLSYAAPLKCLRALFSLSQGFQSLLITRPVPSRQVPEGT
jgi:hypothetical protein